MKVLKQGQYLPLVLSSWCLYAIRVGIHQTFGNRFAIHYCHHLNLLSDCSSSSLSCVLLGGTIVLTVAEGRF